MKVAITNIKLKLHAATQPLFTLVYYIKAYTIYDTYNKSNVVVHAQYHKH